MDKMLLKIVVINGSLVFAPMNALDAVVLGALPSRQQALAEFQQICGQQLDNIGGKALSLAHTLMKGREIICASSPDEIKIENPFGQERISLLLDELKECYALYKRRALAMGGRTIERNKKARDNITELFTLSSVQRLRIKSLEEFRDFCKGIDLERLYIPADGSYNQKEAERLNEQVHEIQSNRERLDKVLSSIDSTIEEVAEALRQPLHLNSRLQRHIRLLKTGVESAYVTMAG
jgi:hypothetical protein